MAHGAGSQATQSFVSKPVEIPPEERMRMPTASHDKHLWTSRAQANEQE
jgi:hypothetical protein